jgi:peptidoglycan LD-endopeptidase CwlK
MLNSCHEDLQFIFIEVNKIIDTSIIEGHRDSTRQSEMFSKGLSKLKWPESKHNKIPSMAVDAMPYPIDWNDKERICFFAGIVVGVASRLYDQKLTSHKIRWGGDWDSDRVLSDETFVDMPHFELYIP